MYPGSEGGGREESAVWIEQEGGRIGRHGGKQEMQQGSCATASRASQQMRAA